MSTPNPTSDRRVVANISLSLDGRVNGPGGDYDMSWIVPHAITETSRDHMVRITQPGTTAVLGRKNYEGFAGFWPAVADDADAAEQDRAFSRWLNDVEKVVFSTTLTEAPWGPARLVRGDVAEQVRALRSEDGGDIVVLASTSVIRDLLAADELDRLSITLCPAVAGGGARLLEDGLPASEWSLTDLNSTESGAICLVYDRVRA